jgi:hypothetical protein
VTWSRAVIGVNFFLGLEACNLVISFTDTGYWSPSGCEKFIPKEKISRYTMARRLRVQEPVGDATVKN